jgi:hypothetical protein
MKAIQRQLLQDGQRECVAISATMAQTLQPLLEKAGVLLARNLVTQSERDQQPAIESLSYIA